MASSDLAGKWTYRSFHNNPTPVGGDGEAALNLIFAEAEFIIELVSETELRGAIDWGSGGLDLKGTIRPATATTPLGVEIVGLGRQGPNSTTKDWEYDYNAWLAHQWPNGIKQVPALVGSVIRARPHGNSPAGYVASFVAVKKG
jgi:hypothetical protein